MITRQLKIRQLLFLIYAIISPEVLHTLIHSQCLRTHLLLLIKSSDSRRLSILSVHGMHLVTVLFCKTYFDLLNNTVFSVTCSLSSYLGTACKQSRGGNEMKQLFFCYLMKVGYVETLLGEQWMFFYLFLIFVSAIEVFVIDHIGRWLLLVRRRVCPHSQTQ